MNRDTNAVKPIYSQNKDGKHQYEIDKIPGKWIVNKIGDQPGNNTLTSQENIDTNNKWLSNEIQTIRGGSL